MPDEEKDDVWLTNLGGASERVGWLVRMWKRRGATEKDQWRSGLEQSVAMYRTSKARMLGTLQ